VDKTGWLPLHLAVDARYPRPSVIDYLVHVYPDSLTQSDFYGHTPVLWAARQMNTSILRLLLSKQLHLQQGLVFHQVSLAERHLVFWQTLQEELIQHKHAIRQVSLCQVSLSAEGWELLAIALTHTHTLERLELSQVRFASTNSLALDRILEGNRSLQSLTIDSCTSSTSLLIYMDASTEIYLGLRQKRLQTLDLDLTTTYQVLCQRADLWFCEYLH